MGQPETIMRRRPTRLVTGSGYKILNWPGLLADKAQISRDLVKPACDTAAGRFLHRQHVQHS
jgi:hypothetical protein